VCIFIDLDARFYSKILGKGRTLLKLCLFVLRKHDWNSATNDNEPS